MKIDPADYLTLPQFAEKLGVNKRAVMRALARALADGHDVRETILGRTVVHKRHMPLVRKYHFPRGSAAASKMAKESGRRGGSAKAANFRLRAEFLKVVAATSGRDESGTSGTGDEAPRSE